MSDAHTHAIEGAHHHGHHWDNAEIEFEAAKEGMWIFMVTEVLMFGGLFVAYGILRGLYPVAFHEAHKMLAWKLGATNTVVLITSSITMALAVSSTQRGQLQKATLYLSSTFALACGFLVVKYFEYSAKIHHGLLPAGLFSNHELTNPKSPLFFSLYFVMTGLHGLHVVIGMGLMIWLIVRTQRNQFGPHYYTPVELVGFYWHFVDLVWIYLFPLLYLVG